MPADFSGSLQVVRGPANAPGGQTPGTAPEIFPEASRVFMSVRDTDPVAPFHVLPSFTQPPTTND